AIDARFFESLIQQPACRSDERLSGKIFFMAGLFADKHDAGAAATLPEDGLGPAFPQIACLAVFSGCPERRQRCLFRDERGGLLIVFLDHHSIGNWRFTTPLKIR